MAASGIAGAVLAPRACLQCHHQWSCADRRTDEVIALVRHNPSQLRGLASYDCLRIGESLRWIERGVTGGLLSGAYAGAESSPAGLNNSRMYPLYGLCAMLSVPMIFDFTSHERWAEHRAEVEVIAADFPELKIILAPPPHTDPVAIARLMQRFARISFALCPQELQSEVLVREWVECYARDRILFCSSSKGWASSVEMARTVPLGPSALRAYLYENAARLFGFATAVERVA
jgi:predicted TIM-barrel fold metal-dependent hydrolase